MLEDAKSGKINLIICKDLSRFGRNYIMVGQYTDYLFPMYGIRFIALNDNIDTAKTDNASMDMMPIMNVFNEWFAANTSKKLRAVHSSNAKDGKYKTTFASYGYVKGDDENRTPTIDSEAATVVRRIFDMYLKGMKLKEIADVLNAENVLTPYDYHYQKLRGIDTKGRSRENCLNMIKELLVNNDFNLSDDFDIALSLGYGQFIWSSANYIDTEEKAENVITEDLDE